MNQFPFAPIRNLPPNPRVPELESSFCLAELDNILANCPSRKAPGMDGVGYEFYCGMDYENWLVLLD